MKSIATELMDALTKLDHKLSGLGLYACCDAHKTKGLPFWKVEWEMGLRPRLLQLGCMIEEMPDFGQKSYHDHSIRFMTPSAKICDLNLVRISNVKVARYGSGYQVDPAHDFDWRWSCLNMRGRIRQLWWPAKENASSDIRLVLFLGFDSRPAPFRKEILALEQALRWKDHHVDYRWKCWKDEYDRDFKILLGCWSYGET